MPTGSDYDHEYPLHMHILITKGDYRKTKVLLMQRQLLVLSYHLDTT
jgi:hypothetical protein